MSNITIGNSQHTADADQTNNTGVFYLSLTAAQTALLNTGAKKEIVTQITTGSTIVSYHGPSLLVVLPAQPKT